MQDFGHQQYVSFREGTSSFSCFIPKLGVFVGWEKNSGNDGKICLLTMADEKEDFLQRLVKSIPNQEFYLEKLLREFSQGEIDEIRAF